jgi:replication fork clamp-binding protein CrfC
MNRPAHLIGLLVLAVAVGICSDQNKAEKPPPPPKAQPRGGAPKGGQPKMGPRITNPASQAARLYQLSPEEREQALEKLPAQQQQAIRQQLKYFDSLPKDQQEMMVKRAERLAALSPQERREFQQAFQALNHLPPERRQMVAQALRRLQLLPEAERVIRLNSPAFKNRFTPDELNMIDKLSEVVLPPM